MPIRLNLLAEQQAEEEARRRDPVKRAVWAGAGLVALIVLWSVSLQFQISSLKSDLARQEARWKDIEPKFLQVSNNFRDAGLIRKSLESLAKHVTNRFLWANSLEALQHSTDERVRVVTLTGASLVTEQKPAVFSTNLFFDVPQRRWWQWRAEPLKTNVTELANRLLGTVTNKPEFVRYQSTLTSSLVVSTNPIQVAAKIDVIKPETATEKVSLTLRARDYGSPPGKLVDRFYQGITNAPFFKGFLGRTNSGVQPESIQSREDRTDSINPGDLYIPFTVELNFPERIRANE